MQSDGWVGRSTVRWEGFVAKVGFESVVENSGRKWTVIVMMTMGGMKKV